MFKDIQSYQSRFVLKERNVLIDYPNHDLELIFVKPPKFDRPLDQLETLTEKWLFFLKNTRQLTAIPDEIGQTPEIRQTFEIANEVNLSAEELDDQEKVEMYIYDERRRLKQAEQRTEQRGEQSGELRGEQRGRQQEKRAIALSLLALLDNASISQATGLTLDEVQQLRPEARDS